MRQDMEKLYRLFAAVDFWENDKEKLYQYVLSIKENSVKGNFTHEENLHLTLAFIGETGKRTEAEEALKEGVKISRVEPFKLETQKLGRFKNNGGDILWIGLKESPQLVSLNEEITKSLRAQDFYIEEQKFKAHLTIGRGVVFKKDVRLEELSDSIPKLSLAVSSVHLMNSERIDGKLRYSSLCKVSLY